MTELPRELALKVYGTEQEPAAPDISEHQHGPYIVTEWEYEEQYIYHEGTGQSTITPGTCKAITYRCSICLEPWEPQP